MEQIEKEEIESTEELNTPVENTDTAETPAPAEMPESAGIAEDSVTEEVPENSEVSVTEEAPVNAENPDYSEVPESVEAPEVPEAAEAVPTEKTEQSPAEAPVQVWSYAAQVAADKKKRKKAAGRGALIYAIIMTAAFCICLGSLLAILVTGFGTPSGTQTPNTPGTPGGSVVIEAEDRYAVAEVYDRVCPSVVGITVSITNEAGQSGTGTGTGIILSADGYIITNYHVIENGNAISVVLHNRQRVAAELVGGDPDSDIAVVKIAPRADLVPATFGNSDEIRVGEKVFAIGNPSGIEYYDTLTVGYVSAVNRAVRVYDDSGYVVKSMFMTQTDTPLNPGNSGGPLINMKGEVIGINTLKLTDAESMGFAIQINGALTVARGVIENGKYEGDAVAQTGVSLGISIIAVRKGEAVRGVTPTTIASADGIFVVSVTEGKPAYNKLKPGDIITSIDGFGVIEVEEMRERLLMHRRGETVTLEVVRNGAKLEITIRL